MRRAVLIVDDHAPFRRAARELLDVEGYDVVGEAEDGESGVVSRGRTVVYTGWNSWKSKPANGRVLFAVGIHGDHLRRLTPWKLGAGDHQVFSSDGKQVLFRSFREEDEKQSDYWTVAPDTRRLTRLTHFKKGTSVLSGPYSPDSRWIVHATDGVDGRADVFVMRADGSANTSVTRTKAWDSAPDWGPAGS